MSGRSIESTNSWDKAMNSVAQQTYESKATDVYRDFPQAPAELNFEDADERREIFRIVYGDVIREHGGHVDLDAIDAECIETMERDPAQAKRFFGNILTQGLGAWMPADLWQLGYAGNK
jgi:hypothetical protein